MLQSKRLSNDGAGDYKSSLRINSARLLLVKSFFAIVLGNAWHPAEAAYFFHRTVSTEQTNDQHKLQFEKHEKCLASNLVTQRPCQYLTWVTSSFSPVLTLLTTVKLGFDQIRTMTSVSSDFRRCSLLFLVLFVASETFAKLGNNANSTPISSSATKQCNYVYNSFYAAPNKKIESFLQEMKTQLTHVEDDINILKGNKTSEKGKYTEVWWCFESRSPQWKSMRKF